MLLMDRDYQILKAISEFGCLTSTQISSLFFSHIKVTQKRLRKLLKEDYVRRVSMPHTKAGRSPSLYFLGEKGSQITGSPIHKPRQTLSLSHMINNNDLFIQIFLSLKNSPIQCEIMPEHIIRTTGQEIIPDAALMLRNNGNQALFLLENCSGTEIIKSPFFHNDIQNKILNYVELFEAADKNEPYESFFDAKFRRFRLLYITNSPQRLAAIKEIVLDHDNHGFIYLTTINELKNKSILGDIWNIPAKNKSNAFLIEGT